MNHLTEAQRAEVATWPDGAEKDLAERAAIMLEAYAGDEARAWRHAFTREQWRWRRVVEGRMGPK